MKIKTALKVDEKGNVYIPGSSIMIYVISVILISFLALYYLRSMRAIKRQEIDKKYEEHQKEKKNEETGILIYPHFEMKA